MRLANPLYYDRTILDAIAGAVKLKTMTFGTTRLKKFTKIFSMPHIGVTEDKTIAANQGLKTSLKPSRWLNNSKQYQLNLGNNQSRDRVTGCCNDCKIVHANYSCIANVGIDGLWRSREDAISNTNKLQYRLTEPRETKTPTLPHPLTDVLFQLDGEMAAIAALKVQTASDFSQAHFPIRPGLRKRCL